MFGLPAAATRVGNQSIPEKMPFSTLPRGYLARPAQQRGHTKTAFHSGTLASGERSIAAIRPGKVLCAIVGSEDDDGVVVDAHVLELFHQQPDVIVELRHPGFLEGPTVLRV